MLSLFLSIACTPIPTSVAVAPSTPLGVASQATNPTYEQKRKEAGKDVAKLWALYEWCVAQKLEKEGKSTLRAIVQVDPTHRAANEALGYVEHEGKWFPSQKKLEEHKKQQAELAAKALEKEAKEKGLAIWQGKLVPPADVPFLERGLVKDEAGKWVDPADQKRIAEGWVKQDFEWVSAEDKPKLEQGLWKCGDEWLPLKEADEHHAEIATWWRIPTKRYHLYTTLDRTFATGTLAMHLDAAYDDLVRVYGREPATPPLVMVLRDKEQYDAFAAGDENEQRPASETHGFSSVHYAYLSDFGWEGTKPRFGGVSFWDNSSEEGRKWGIHQVRHAMGQAFAEALDPSPRAVQELVTDLQNGEVPDLEEYGESFYAEKRIPTWLRFGAAAYAERWFVDRGPTGGENPRWSIAWSSQNLVARGGLRSIKQLFEFEPDVDEAEDTQKWLNEIGLIVAFVVDGNVAPVVAQHKVLQEALASGRDRKAIAEAAKELVKLVEKHETELRKFAGL